MPCPACRAVVPNRHPVGKPYRCAACGAELQLSRRQGNVEFWIGILVAAALAWLLGFRGWALAGMTALFAIPVGFLSIPVFEKLWPARLEPYDGGRVI